MGLRNSRKSKSNHPEIVAKTKSGRSLVVDHDVAEQMRSLVKRSQLLESRRTVLAVSAATVGEGASFVSSSLAVTLAHDTSRSVCLVDLDWTASSPRDEGSIVSLARGDASLDDELTETTVDDLYTLGSSEIPMLERAAFAGSSELRDTLDEIADRFDVVILDVPPLGNRADAVAACALADATIFVVMQGGAPFEQVRLAIEDLGKDRVLGVVLNQFNIRAPKWLLDPMVAS